MNNSILTSTKKKIGIMPDDTSFDEEIIDDINGVLASLTDIGVGPAEGYRITSDIETWEDFVGDTKRLSDVKTYVRHKTKLIFDPPLSGTVIQQMKEEIKEIEWRLNNRVDKGV